ncbi:hypothetical protein H206_05406 [Candidatus Electrothrix aarhusensis]|uniref:Uncharacterized protein n=1 Tax=Candidatus Electrothrix aarhusensis TaxID=1859131 RepID=A0A444J4K2_9BACT|nr:hypothetical protein H206_05406 [Candidatus Electrothrix aarhusensis]
MRQSGKLEFAGQRGRLCWLFGLGIDDDIAAYIAANRNSACPGCNTSVLRYCS